MNSNHGLTHSPQRGWVTYVQCYTTYKTERVDGWFSVGPNNQTIYRRKIGGRNVYQFSHISRVISFQPDPTTKD